MSATFDGNPAVDFATGSGRGHADRRLELAHFLAGYAADRHGLFFSSDRNGVMVACRSDHAGPALRTLLREIRLVFCAIGLRRLKRVLIRSARVNRLRASRGRHIHCWYIGVMNEARGSEAARELQHLLFDWSDREALPVLAETTIMRNRKAYEFIGFLCYAEVVVGGMTTWLLVRNPSDSHNTI